MLIEFDIFKPYADKLEQGVMKDYEDIQDAVVAEQIHTDVILEVDEIMETLPESDAFMTQKRGLALVAKTADCQGVLIYDPINEAIASVHSGWRGSAMNIIGKTIRKMAKAYDSDPSELLVAIGPSLGPCCAEFSDPRNELPAFCHKHILDNNHVDFWALSLAQLGLEGVELSNIEITRQCTKCQPGFYSHRNGDGGRMGIFVKLK